MKRSPLTGVVFDFGGVLYGVDYAVMAREVAGDRAPDFLDAFVGSPLQVAYETGRAGLAQVLHAFQELGFPVGRSRFLEAYLSVFTPIPGVRSLLERLAAHRPLGLLSNTSPEHARLFIEQTPEFRLFRARVYSFEIGCMKPAPETYREIGQRLGVPLAGLAYTDDVEEYARGAEDQGMAGIPFRGAAELEVRLGDLGFPEVSGA